MASVVRSPITVLLLASACLFPWAGFAVPASAAQPGTDCAPGVTRTTTGQAGPATSSANRGPACWTEVRPYPFGATGEAVDTTTPDCAPTLAGDALPCYLTVTSMAFRSWNRGLAELWRENAIRFDLAEAIGRLP